MTYFQTSTNVPQTLARMVPRVLTELTRTRATVWRDGTALTVTRVSTHAHRQSVIRSFLSYVKPLVKSHLRTNVFYHTYKANNTNITCFQTSTNVPLTRAKMVPRVLTESTRTRATVWRDGTARTVIKVSIHTYYFTGIVTYKH
jgi:hypothetical protein